jgi:hypothetical protein
VIWRWYDAVVLGDGADLIRLWETHVGDSLRSPRRVQRPRPVGNPGSPFAGLSGADW